MSEQANNAGGKPPCRVLICDDVLLYRRLLITVLDRADGFVVVGEAENGLRAIEVAREQQPAVVLLDVAMPVLDGLEALPRILAASPASRVIVLTGFEAQETRARALTLGAFAYIEKGASPARIVEAVRAACEC